MISALFWDFTQTRIAVSYRRFWTTYQYKIKKLEGRKEKNKFTCLSVNEHDHDTAANTSLTHTSAVVITKQPVVSSEMLILVDS
jgi:hypothetical protein